MAHKILAGLLLITIALKNLTLGERREDFVCDENVSYIVDDNYPCECLPNTNHTLACDYSKCPPNPKPKEKCILGTKWYKFCNTCWCRTIGTVCTNFECTIT